MQLTRALTDSDGATWQDYFKTLDHMHSAHLAAAREDELMHVSDLTSSLHELQDGEDDSGAVAVGAIKSEDDMKRVAAELGAGDYEPFNVEQVELEAEVDEPTSPHHSKTVRRAILWPPCAVRLLTTRARVDRLGTLPSTARTTCRRSTRRSCRQTRRP